MGYATDATNYYAVITRPLSRSQVVESELGSNLLLVFEVAHETQSQED